MKRVRLIVNIKIVGHLQGDFNFLFVYPFLLLNQDRMPVLNKMAVFILIQWPQKFEYKSTILVVISFENIILRLRSQENKADLDDRLGVRCYIQNQTGDLQQRAKNTIV